MEIVPDDPVKFTTTNNINHFTLKKKRKRNTICTRTSNGCYIILDEDIVVHEILTRLPVKSLIRFKSVCKQWNSVIPQRNPNLLIIEKWPCGDGRPDYLILTGKIERCIGRTTEEEVVVSIDNTIKTTLSFDPEKITNCINGLICLIDPDFNHDPCLYNINTGEETQLFMSPLLKQEKRSGGAKCLGAQFGLDPVTNEHKLVWAWWSRDHSGWYKQFCEVLTIVGGRRINENNEWRNINHGGDFDVKFADPSVHVNGTIYWSSLKLRYYCICFDEVFMVAFDVRSEKFRYIRVPEFILDQYRKHSKDANCSNPKIDLLEVDRRVALQIKIINSIVKLWIFDDDKKGITTSDKNWSEVTVNLPFCLEEARHIPLHMVFDQIILRTYDYTNSYDSHELKDQKNKKNISLHSFDWRKNMLTKFTIRGTPFSFEPFDIHLADLFTTFFKIV